MSDNMEVLREITKTNRDLADVKQLITSSLDLQNRMLSCESNTNSPQLNTDFVVGNIDQIELQSILFDLEIGRQCFAIGASIAGLSFIHSANEKIVLSRSKHGFMAKNLRSSFSQQATSIKDDSGGFRFGRSKDGRA